MQVHILHNGMTYTKIITQKKELGKQPENDARPAEILTHLTIYF